MTTKASNEPISRKEEDMKRTLAILVLILVKLSPAQEAEEKIGSIQIEAKLGKDVVDRELTEEATTFTLGERAYLWMRVTDGAGQAITVVWAHGEHRYETTLEIGGSPWRTWAYKTVGHAGEWSVSVRDAEGKELANMTFQVMEQMKAD